MYPTICRQMPVLRGDAVHRDLKENLNVAPLRSPYARSGQRTPCHVLDNGTYTRVDVPNVPQDPLKLRDKKKYADIERRASQDRRKRRHHRRKGPIDGLPVIIAAFNFSLSVGKRSAHHRKGILNLRQNRRQQMPRSLPFPHQAAHGCRRGRCRCRLSNYHAP